MTEKLQFVDFGAPDKFGAHLFRVEIPAVRTEGVRIVEDFGYRGLEGGIPKDEDRAILPRAVWSGIADIARREFNDRLKIAKVSTGRWHTGTNLVDRLLGKELCVLAWAAETANDDQLPVICSTWAALRPEERWWLFSTPCLTAKNRPRAANAVVRWRVTCSACRCSKPQNERFC
jgi:hypothetical protein